MRTVAAAEADAADHCAVNNDRKAADENSELAVETPLYPKRLIPRQRWAIRHLVEQMGGAAMPGRVNALFQAICGPVMRAPSIRSINSGWPPSSVMHTVSATPISCALAVAAATIWRASEIVNFRA